MKEIIENFKENAKKSLEKMIKTREEI